MWDTVQTSSFGLSHDLPCQRCGHAPHTYLSCDDECGCQPMSFAVATGVPLSA